MRLHHHAIVVKDMDKAIMISRFNSFVTIEKSIRAEPSFAEEYFGC